jgi:site-specific recombinase XerD
VGRIRDPARGLPRGCTDCLAWGVMEQIRCRACRSFRDGHRDERECTGCGRPLRVKDGYCRLCWVQLSSGQAWEGTPPSAVAALAASGTKVGYHQLFFDKMSPRAGARPEPRAAAGKAPRPGWAWVQPDLPAPAAAPARPRSRQLAEPLSPSLACALRAADRLAESRGWSSGVRHRVRKGLRTALAGCAEGEAVRWSLALPALRAGRLCARHVAMVLRQEGLLDDDRPPAFDAWLDRKLDGVASGIRRDAERWLRTLKDGGPRSRPRAIATVHSHLGKALPALADWSARYDHLREVTRGDIQDFLRPLHGSDRHNALVALRSLFAFCTASGVVFRNPTRGIKVGRRPSATVMQPLGQDDIDDAVAAAATPAARLVIALAGVHAARSSTICSLSLADADPASRRLLVNGRPRPLDDLTARLLRAWLEDRRARWSGTANPYLLINAQTALGTGPVSRTWVNTALRGHTATIEALRTDRQLEEALASGADPLHLAATFGLDPGTAVRYASSARQLLQTGAEQHSPGRLPANPRAGSPLEP